MEKRKHSAGGLGAALPGLLAGISLSLALLYLGAVLIQRGTVDMALGDSWTVCVLVAAACVGAAITGAGGRRRMIPVVWALLWGVLVLLSIGANRGGGVGTMALKTGVATAAGALIGLAICINRGRTRRHAHRRSNTNRNRARS